MIYLQIFLTSILSIVVMFLITKMLGYRQLSELSLFDYITGITIGSIAGDLAIAEKEDILPFLFSMVIYGFVTLLISFSTNKSFYLRKLITGRPVVLIDKGKFIYKNFKKVHIDINEFLVKCRNSGYFDISAINTAIMEPNGKVSFIPMAADKPVTASDIKAVPKQEVLFANVIVDGKIVQTALESVGKDKKWLVSKLRSMGYDEYENIFLATCDNNLTVTCYKKD